MMTTRSDKNISLHFDESAGLGLTGSKLSVSHYNSKKSRGFSVLSLACIAGAIAFSSTAMAQDTSLFEKEIQARHEGVILAQELLVKGDSSYKKAEYAEAVKSYSKAFELIPRGAITDEIKNAAAERYAQAVVENAKALSRLGQTDVAREQLKAVLRAEVAPGNLGAQNMLAKLDDPIRTSPTLTPEHVSKVAEVGQLLRKAESYFLQGQYDASLVAYEEVLKLDAYNSAARRGMSKVNAEMSRSRLAGRDHYRSHALAQVAEGWERKVNEERQVGASSILVEDEGLFVQDQIAKNNKVKNIIVPEVNFSNTTFDDAIRIIRSLTRELDTTELDPANKGVNYVTRLGDEDGDFAKKVRSTKFSLELRGVPISEVLDRVTQATGTYWRAERHAIVIRPLGSESADLEVRTFRVPVGFLDDAGETQEGGDLFSTAQSGLQQKMTALEYFQKLGIAFPEGSFASLTRHNNRLTVKNTPLALDSIETFIRAQSLDEQVQVVVHVTIMEVQQNHLEELGYDTLVQSNSTNSVSLGGGTAGNQSAPVLPITGGQPNALFQGSPINSGNRSGDSAFVQDPLDGLIAASGAGETFAGGEVNRAPGVLQLTGTVSDNTYQAILRAVSQKDDDSSVIVPSVVTAPGQKATIYAGQDFTYPEEYEPGEVPNLSGGSLIVTPATPSSFTTTQLGVQLDIEPTVSDDKNYIDLNINPVMRSFEGFVNYGSSIESPTVNPITGAVSSTPVVDNAILQPVFSTIRTNTNVTIQDGQTIVIGGLLEQRIDKIEDKTPILGDLPLVGRFFKSDALDTTKTAVVIFVKAELVDPTGQPWRKR